MAGYRTGRLCSDGSFPRRPWDLADLRVAAMDARDARSTRWIKEIFTALIVRSTPLLAHFSMVELIKISAQNCTVKIISG